MKKIGLGRNLSTQHYYPAPQNFGISPDRLGVYKNEWGRIPSYGSYINAVFSDWCKENRITNANLLTTLKLMVLSGELTVIKQSPTSSMATTRAISRTKGVNISAEASEGLYTICSPLGYPLNNKQNTDMILAYTDTIDTLTQHSLKTNRYRAKETQKG